MTSFSLTAEGLNELQADITQAGAQALPRARQALQVTAPKVRDDARAFASGLAHAPLYPRAITYDTTLGPLWAEAEIGPDKNKPQGALGNVLEFGTVNNPPHTHLGPAADRNAPDLERGLSAAAADLL
jgi:hypothetical protein